MEQQLMLDVGQANEIKLAFRRAGYTNADIKRMCEGDTLARVLPVIRGYGKVILQHTIDCDADPFVPDDWEVEEHAKGGQFEWDPSKIELFRSEQQKKGLAIRGTKFREELKSKSVLNANVLDFLLKYPQLIPEEWKDHKRVFFLDTTYSYADEDHLSVRCLIWHSDWHDDHLGWQWGFSWLDSDFEDDYVAVVLASS